METLDIQQEHNTFITGLGESVLRQVVEKTRALRKKQRVQKRLQVKAFDGCWIFDRNKGGGYRCFHVKCSMYILIATACFNLMICILGFE